MRPFPKLWVLIEQVNSDIGSSSTVEMDTVLEPLEKMVLLIGNVIMQLHMKEGKMFYWVSQGPLHHKSLQCLKKREHSYKNTIRCFLEYFRDHLTKSLKATKQSVEPIAEDGLLRGSTERGPFERAKVKWRGQKFSSNYNGKYILLKKKETLSQQQPNFTSSYGKL